MADIKIQISRVLKTKMLDTAMKADGNAFAERETTERKGAEFSSC